jgi:hypothetical protein
MAVLVTAIHVFERVQDVDPRNKSGDDGEGCSYCLGKVMAAMGHMLVKLAPLKAN